MHSLSNQSQKYCRLKNDKLRGFVVKDIGIKRQLSWRVSLLNELEFGKPFRYPNQSQLEAMAHFESVTGMKIKLSSIRYKREENKLVAIQFIYSNEF